MVKNLFVLYLLSITLLVSCGSPVNTNSNLTTNSQATHSVDTISNYSVDDFMKKFSSKLVLSPGSTDGTPRSEIYDITPRDIHNKIGCQIFKDGTYCSSYVVYKDKVYPISKSLGGFGIVDMKTCDYNKDGQLDIIYSSSWGLGIHRWEIGLFDFTTMTDSTIFSSFGNTSSYEVYTSDICFDEKTENTFNIYTVSFKEQTPINFAKLEYTKDKLIGKVVDENNAPKIILN